MHVQLHQLIDSLLADMWIAAPTDAQEFRRLLHFSTDNGTRITIPRGVRDTCLYMSSLPSRFRKHGVTAGIVFITTFNRDLRSTASLPPPLTQSNILNHTIQSRTL